MEIQLNIFELKLFQIIMNKLKYYVYFFFKKIFGTISSLINLSNNSTKFTFFDNQHDKTEINIPKFIKYFPKSFNISFKTPAIDGFPNSANSFFSNIPYDKKVDNKYNIETKTYEIFIAIDTNVSLFDLSDKVVDVSIPK